MFKVANILFIEDNAELAELVSDFLSKSGYTVYKSESGTEGLDLSKMDIDLVLLDLMLPDMDGFFVCSEIRKKKRVPIIIMSARCDKDSKILALELGADDYIEKPFDVDVMLAKINANLRRENMIKSNVFSDREIKIDMTSRRVFKNDEEIFLTIKEYDVLSLLISNKGRPLRKEYIFSYIWGNDSFSELSTLTVHINKLREKIEVNPKDPKRIITVWGIGYKYETL